ncbi:hypothetical protein [Pseudoalteromonas aurantia]|uniref:Bacteriocin n=1 Tax=Pseudoalteromonas aurantia 208 TaxID=1314867 RepID=A0ABR9EG65_9GAMM|nr:hypothetical protein [Pseudoalteromonas aurantia]MBE0369996.1 hypothetical protein [Pseudoalteromonas aurantia 208]
MMKLTLKTKKIKKLLIEPTLDAKQTQRIAGGTNTDTITQTVKNPN